MCMCLDTHAHMSCSNAATLCGLRQGVTGVVGEPYPDLERGVREEHCQKPDSFQAFTSP